MNPSKTEDVWNSHYTRAKSKLSFPDENLVRILSKLPISNGRALDFGAGSGRHSLLLKSFGWEVTALDFAKNSLDQIHELDESIGLVHATEPPYPFQDGGFDLIVSWGVLHYNSSELISRIVSEYHRILKDGAFIAGTIRADRDTHLKIKDGQIQLSDLKSAQAQLFSQKEVVSIFKNFSNVQLGYMERTPMGKLEERICHWIFLVQK